MDTLVGRWILSRVTPCSHYARLMSRKSKPTGPCRICGEENELTFEHLPPKAAFNRYPVAAAHLHELFNVHPANYSGRRHRDFQSGFGVHALCGSCNNNTGSWYAREFASWVDQSLRILRGSGVAVEHVVDCRFDIYPLRVIKQICAMFLSLNDPVFQSIHEYLSRFVLNKYKIGLHPSVQISAYLTAGPNLRYSADMLPQHMSKDYATPVRLESMIDEAGRVIERREYPTEISFPPLGYAMTFRPDMGEEKRANISHFALYDYNQKISRPVSLPILPVYTWYYSDYRTLEEIESQAGLRGGLVGCDAAMSVSE